MLSIISLISILTIFTQINCVPVQPNAESRDSSKYISLNLYQSNLKDSTSDLSEPTISDFKEDDEGNWEEDFLRDGRKACKAGSEIRHICEQCAKITKSEKGYAYCCTNKSKLRDWCINYIDFLYLNKE